jgi:hypothetical protein
MRATIIFYGDLDSAMKMAESFEVLANVHITGYTHKTDGTVHIQFEENEDTASTELVYLEYIDLDEYEFDGHDAGDCGGDNYDESYDHIDEDETGDW